MKMLTIVLLLLSQVCLAGNAMSVRTVYSVTPVDTSTALVLVNELPQQVTHVAIFDSSGKTMQLRVDGGGPIDYILIPPGGGDFPVKMSKGSKVSLIAVSATAGAGESDINFFY